MRNDAPRVFGTLAYISHTLHFLNTPHTHPHAHIQTHTQTHARTRSRSRSRTHTRIHTHTHAHAHALTPTHQHTHQAANSITCPVCRANCVCAAGVERLPLNLALKNMVEKLEAAQKGKALGRKPSVLVFYRYGYIRIYRFMCAFKYIYIYTYIYIYIYSSLPDGSGARLPAASMAESILAPCVLGFFWLSERICSDLRESVEFQWFFIELSVLMFDKYPCQKRSSNTKKNLLKRSSYSVLWFKICRSWCIELYQSTLRLDFNCIEIGTRAIVLRCWFMATYEWVSSTYG